MKKILITGASGYIGQSFMNYVSHQGINFEIDTLEIYGDDWKQQDFSNYDAILHLAGLAHVSTNEDMKAEYYDVNTYKTIDLAQLAKAAGVKHFVFMSSIIVYGSKVPGGKITADTQPNPDDFYGDSKLQAELGIHSLNDANFKIAVLRPPMIYGPHSKGNFPKLMKLAQLTPIFPNYTNRRSMLYIENLHKYLVHVLQEERTGLFFPQNNEYTNTSQMVQQIATLSHRSIWLTKLFNPLIHCFINQSIVNKVFGNLYYESNNYQAEFIPLKESLAETLNQT